MPKNIHNYEKGDQRQSVSRFKGTLRQRYASKGEKSTKPVSFSKSLIFSYFNPNYTKARFLEQEC